MAAHTFIMRNRTTTWQWRETHSVHVLRVLEQREKPRPCCKAGEKRSRLIANYFRLMGLFESYTIYIFLLNDVRVIVANGARAHIFWELFLLVLNTKKWQLFARPQNSLFNDYYRPVFTLVLVVLFLVDPAAVSQDFLFFFPEN